MAPKYSHLLLAAILALVAVVVPTLATSRSLAVGNWTPLENLKDPHVISIAQFAVREYNKEKKTNLHFVYVVKGESQVVHGVNYRLVISAINQISTSNAVEKTYTAIVYERNAGFRSLKLISFV